jgi:hypothetical protein
MSCLTLLQVRTYDVTIARADLDDVHTPCFGVDRLPEPLLLSV